MKMPTMADRLFHRASLTTKMLLLTVTVGVLVWAASDYFERLMMRDVFKVHLSELLSHQAEEDRKTFDSYVRAYGRAAVLIASQKSFIDYMEEKRWFVSEADGITYYKSPPPWSPRSSVLRALVHVRFAQLLDGEGRVREVYQGMPGPLPQSLLEPTDLMRRMSHTQSFMTRIDGLPYLIASVSTKGGATLMLASPLDEEFLITAQSPSAKGHVMALVEGEPGRVLASNRPDLLPAGTGLDTLKDRYLITGKGFFDYGVADIDVGLFSFIPTAEIDSMIVSIMARERLHHSLKGIILLASFALIMLWVTRRIGRLGGRVTEFSSEALGTLPQGSERGDQMDILEERFQSLTEEVSRRTTQLEAVNRELEAFSYSVSHDLRAPLRAIDGFSQAVLDDYADRLDETGRDYLRRVREGSGKMLRLIEDMLALSRLSRAEMHRETVDLSAVAREVSKELYRGRPERRVRFVIAEGVKAEGDARLLRVVLENLLGNAWKFTGRHGSARIEFGREVSDGKVVCFVRDDGAGFDPAHADRLFGVFQRLHSAEEFEGTGVGLATVQRIIQRHGGGVWAEGAVERGATFYFTLDHEGKGPG
jgi:signal transduction histidine kinase